MLIKCILSCISLVRGRGFTLKKQTGKTAHTCTNFNQEKELFGKNSLDLNEFLLKSSFRLRVSQEETTAETAFNLPSKNKRKNSFNSPFINPVCLNVKSLRVFFPPSESSISHHKLGLKLLGIKTIISLSFITSPDGLSCFCQIASAHASVGLYWTEMGIHD